MPTNTAKPTVRTSCCKNAISAFWYIAARQLSLLTINYVVQRHQDGQIINEGQESMGGISRQGN